MSVYILQAEAIFDGKSILPSENVLEVSENGEIVGIRPLLENDKNVKNFRGLLTPGLINTHCHLELSHLKNAIPRRTGMVDFLMSVVKFRHIEENEIVEISSKMAKKMYDSGISVVGDICNTGVIQQILEDCPLKFYHFVEAIGFNPLIASSRFDHSQNIQKKYGKYFPSSVVPHAPYSVSKKLYQLINQQSDEKVISIHHAESIAEQDFFQKKHSDFDKLHDFIKSDLSNHLVDENLTSIQTFLPLFTNKKILLVHNVEMSEADLIFIKEIELKNNLEVYFSICVQANLYIGNGYPNLDLLFKYFPERITIGTDSLASNDELNMMYELKLLKNLYPTLTNEVWLKMLTSQGANALNYQGQYGSFATGLKPGVVNIDIENFTSKRVF